MQNDGPHYDGPYYEWAPGNPIPHPTPPSSQPVPPPAQPAPMQSPPQWMQAAPPPMQPMQPMPPHPPAPRKRWPFILASILGAALVIFVLIFGALQLSRNRQSGPTSTPTAAAHATSVATTAPTRTAAFQSATCPFQLGGGVVEGQMVNCGYVTVPENRSISNGRTVRLAVAIFKAQHSQPNPANAYPVIRLDGGPGGPSLDDWAHYITSSNYNTFVFNQDLIMFDQRGTGHSQPSLNCPEFLQLQYNTINRHLSRTDSDHLNVLAAQACYIRLTTSGIDLNAYNTLENAADVRDVIQALGYKQATLYGVSYGTRLALTVTRLYPSVIHGVVLDSTYPPQKNRNDLPQSAKRVFNVLFSGCAASTSCNSRYPNLANVFYSLVDQLNAQPIHFVTKDAYTGTTYTASFAGDDLIFWLYGSLYATQFIPLLPQTIFQIRAQNYTQLSFLYSYVNFDDTLSYGLFYSASCSEDWPFLTKQDITTAVQGTPPQIAGAFGAELQQEYDICQIWHVRQLPAAQKQPVASSLPTLILSGEYDPITPPAYGQLAAQTLNHSYYELFPGMGHGEEYNSDCADSIISAFEDNPAQKPADSCISTMAEPNFQ